MGQFRSANYFSFDGKNSKSYGLQIVSVGESQDEALSNLFGVKRSVIREKSVGDTPVFYGVEMECPTFSIQLAKVNSAGDIQPFNSKDLQEIGRWLFAKREFAPLIVNNLIYSVIFTEGQDFLNSINQGYLTLKMEMEHPYALSIKSVNNILCDGEKKKISISNKSTATETITPELIISISNSSCKNLRITNLNAKNTLTLTNLDPYSNIIIDCKNRQMKDLKNEEQNIFAKSNREFLELRYGINEFLIDSDGTCNIKIIVQSCITFS